MLPLPTSVMPLCNTNCEGLIESPSQILKTKEAFYNMIAGPAPRIRTDEIQHTNENSPPRNPNQEHPAREHKSNHSRFLNKKSDDQTVYPGASQTPPSSPATATEMIMDVWNSNMDEEFRKIRKLLHTYRYIALDTEYPGTTFKGRHFDENQFEDIRDNVNARKLIQLGISLFDEKGNSPPGTCTWQFNFKFDYEVDEGQEDSIILLMHAGLQFERHRGPDAIDTEDFGHLWYGSGLYNAHQITWITYHGAFDFSYLLKTLIGRPLPESDTEYYDLFKLFFPIRYDIKSILLQEQDRVPGLNNLAENYRIRRIGTTHQAGSDALLSGKVFFHVKRRFNRLHRIEMHLGLVYGLLLENTREEDLFGDY